MNAEVKAEWVKALRSGEYEQTTGALNKGGQFCCLGVLCDLAVKAGVVEAFQVDSLHTGYGDNRVTAGTALLPAKVIAWSGMPDPSGGFDHDANDNPRNSLANLNDFRGYNFEQIADAIEENF